MVKTYQLSILLDLMFLKMDSVIVIGAPLKPLRDDSALRALSSLRGLRGAPAVPPLCRETHVSRTATVGI